MPSFITEDDTNFGDYLGSGNYMGTVVDLEKVAAKSTGKPQIRVRIKAPQGQHTEWIKIDELGNPLPGFPNQVRTQHLLRAMSIPDASFWQRYDDGVREPLVFEWDAMLGKKVYFELRRRGEYLNLGLVAATAPAHKELGPIKEAPRENMSGMDFGSTATHVDDNVPF